LRRGNPRGLFQRKNAARTHLPAAPAAPAAAAAPAAPPPAHPSDAAVAPTPASLLPPPAPPLPADLLHRLDLAAHLPPYNDPLAVDASHELHARLVAALARPILNDDGTLLGTAGHMLLGDLAGGGGGGGRDSPAGASARAVGGVPWMHRAQVVFHVVDSAGRGWVDAGECEALARAFLSGAGGAAEGPLKEYFEDLAGEGGAVVAGAVAAEAAAMMEFAEGGRLSLKGFSRWLAAFMEALEEDAGSGGGGGAAAPPPPPATPAGPPPYSLTPDAMDEGGEGGHAAAAVNFSAGSLGSAAEADVSAEEARAAALGKAAAASWAAAPASSEPSPSGAVNSGAPSEPAEERA